MPFMATFGKIEYSLFGISNKGEQWKPCVPVGRNILSLILFRMVVYSN